MTVEEIILGVFAISNMVRVVAYFPQIVKIAKDHEGATAVSNGTWALFGVSHLSTVAYAFVVLGDLYMTLLFTANLFCCLAIIILTFWKRWKFKALRLQQMKHFASEMLYPEAPQPMEQVHLPLAIDEMEHEPARQDGVPLEFPSKPNEA